MATAQLQSSANGASSTNPAEYPALKRADGNRNIGMIPMAKSTVGGSEAIRVGFIVDLM